MWLSSIICFNHKSKILYYHDICGEKSYKSLDSDVLMGTPLDVFKEHLKVIQSEGFKVVSHISKSEGEVAILLDDGFRGIWDNRSFFYSQPWKPTVFLAHDLIGKEGFLTIPKILELQNHGFNFECHSWSHTDLTQYSEEEWIKELKESKNWLSKKLNREITEICLPLGYFSDNLVEKINEFGYKEIYSSVPGNYSDLLNNRLRRRNCCQFANPAEVKLILRGGNELIAKRYFRMHYKP